MTEEYGSAVEPPDLDSAMWLAMAPSLLRTPQPIVRSGSSAKMALPVRAPPASAGQRTGMMDSGVLSASGIATDTVALRWSSGWRAVALSAEEQAIARSEPRCSALFRLRAKPDAGKFVNKFKGSI